RRAPCGSDDFYDRGELGMNDMVKSMMGGVLALVATVVACAASGTGDEVRWRAEEIEEIRSLWIGEMEPLAPDPTNRYADDPGALALGHQLFFDTRDRKSTRLNSSHVKISYAVFCLKKQTT